MRHYLWLIFVLTVGLAVRLFFLANGGVTIDSDEAIVGLMAQHIAEGREWPIFYYGQHYMGSLEALLTAPIFLAIGENEWTLKAVPLTSAILFIYLIYLLGSRVGGQFCGEVASLLAAIPPVGFVEWSTKARGGFIELVLLGTIALYIAVGILRKRSVKGPNIILLGLVLGLAWWVNNQAIFFIAAIGIVLAVQILRWPGPKKLRTRRAIMAASNALVSFFLGGLPFWYANLIQTPRFATFKQLGGSAKFPEEFLDHMQGFFSESLPILLGGTRFWTNKEVFSWTVGSITLTSSLLCWVVATVVFIIALARALSSSREERGVILLVLFSVLTPIIFALSSFGWLTIAPRYLLPLYVAWFVLSGIAAKVFKPIVIPILVLALASNYYGGVSAPGQPFVANGERASADHSELYKWLKAHRISHIHTNYWIGYRVAFESREKVTFSLYGEPWTPRIWGYQAAEVDHRDAPFVLVPSQEREVTDALTSLDIAYDRATASGYVIIVPLNIDVCEPQQPIPTQFFDGSSRLEWLKSVADGDVGSRWGSGMPQRPGMYLEGRFSKPEAVEDVEIAVGFWQTDAARDLSVQLIDEQGKSCSIFEGPTQPLHSIFGPKLELSAPGKVVKGIRLEQLGRDPIFDWSLAEVSAFRKKN